MQQQVESVGQLVAVSQTSGLGLGGLGGVGGLGGDGGGLGFFLMGYDACVAAAQEDVSKVVSKAQPALHAQGHNDHQGTLGLTASLRIL
jgi:hypothetical protein